MPIKPSPAVLRAAEVLEYLGRRPGRAETLSEIARRTGVSKATCQSLLMGLAETGLVVRDETSLRYRLGPALLLLGAAAAGGNDIGELARPHLLALSEARQIPAIAAVRAGSRLVAVAATAPPGPFAMAAPTGQSVAFVPPIGAPFVAWGDAAAVEAWLDRSPEPLGSEARARLGDALAFVRELGFAVTLEGVTGELPLALPRRGRYRLSHLSAPIWDHAGDVVMIFTTTPTGVDWTAGQVLEQGRALREAADRVTERLGGAPPAAA